MVFSITVKHETLEYEEPDENDPDISYYVDMDVWTASCFELGLSAKSQSNESTALEYLKAKIAETRNISPNEIEFQLTKEDKNNW